MTERGRDTPQRGCQRAGGRGRVRGGCCHIRGGSDMIELEDEISNFIFLRPGAEAPLGSSTNPQHHRGTGLGANPRARMEAPHGRKAGNRKCETHRLTVSRASEDGNQMLARRVLHE
ncbi:hypothetical protein NDU88_003801 [Pleurodeles waltl]|uniref:Uncharacterized protein n=1 Tax=Pleurodeles waltl TaxID=8319 RepID=A0AAV7T6H6_PLEWA|nr:hypothetical protein NDU88_003801 [Pleurodeles waltl]